MPPAAPDVIRPAFTCTPPSAVGSLVDEVAELAVQLGQEVGPEERIALAALTPVQANGMPAGLEGAIICGRQNVKSWALEMCTIHDGWVTKVGRCMWSAHQTKTSDDNFTHLTSLVESFDWLRKRVKRIYSGNGDHRILFLDGRTIEFGARENGPTGRGRVKVNRLTLDEWLFGTAAMLGAFVPTMGAAGDRYIRYGSSPGRLHSEELRRLRDRLRRGGDPSLSGAEWTSEQVRVEVDQTGRPRLVRVLPSCEDPECSHIAGVAKGCYLDDRRIWRGVNPALGRRITEEFVEQERLAVPPVEFARERCGIWEDPPTADGAADNGLPGYDLATTDRAPVAPLTLGLEVSTDSRTAAIAVHGADVVEVVEYRKGAGLGWVPSRVTELRERYNAAVAVRAGSPALQLLPELPGAVVVKSTEQAAACMSFATAMNAGGLLHRAQPVLDIAVANAVRARTGDVWRWSLSKSAEDRGTDISPLWAAVLARHIGAADTTDRSVEALLTSFG